MKSEKKIIKKKVKEPKYTGEQLEQCYKLMYDTEFDGKTLYDICFVSSESSIQQIATNTDKTDGNIDTTQALIENILYSQQVQKALRLCPDPTKEIASILTKNEVCDIRKGVEVILLALPFLAE